MNYLLNDIMGFLILLPAIIIALTFHECAHGYTAYLLGDSTAKEQGRLTINPLPHLDPVGFLIMLFPPHFGWAKPVQVNPYRFKTMSPSAGMMVVSLAGPGMNILLAVVAMLAIKWLYPYSGTSNGQTASILFSTLRDINILLAVFNLIPIPPLDGSRILAWLLPDSMSEFIYNLERYGFLILLLLMLTGYLGKIINPLYVGLYNLLTYLIM